MNIFTAVKLRGVQQVSNYNLIQLGLFYHFHTYSDFFFDIGKKAMIITYLSNWEQMLKTQSSSSAESVSNAGDNSQTKRTIASAYNKK